MSPVRRLALVDAPGGRHCEIPVTDKASAGISLAAAGDMRLSRGRVEPPRSTFLAERGLPPEHVYGPRQVHSKRVLLIEGQNAEETAALEADGLLTVRTDAVLSITVADCLPIFLADIRTGAIGIVHSGWRGTGIVREALSLMRTRFGSLPAEVAAVIGPGIGACCYTVPDDRAASFEAEFGPETVLREGGGSPRLDLRAANTRLLVDAGVHDIGVVTECTSCTRGLGSFRRQGPADYTLMLAWIRRQAIPSGA
jgi:YfiH family protein